MRFAQIKPFLKGEVDEFAWPHGGSTWTVRHYGEMREGDRIVLWMGDGEASGDWGIQGFASIARIEGAAGDKGSVYVLQRETIPTRSFRPYPCHERQETPELAFLRAIFQKDYKPLSESFGLGNTFVTVFPMKSWQYEALLDRTQNWAA